MSCFATFSDDFYVNLNLNTEMELPSSRETVLHFFERLQKRYPTMRNFYCRDKSDFVLEEEKDRGHYRWASVEPKRVCSGQVNPQSVEEAIEQHKLVLQVAPYMLSVSPLDCESISLMYGFDFSYRGNHNELISEALGIVPAFAGLANLEGSKIICNEPTIQLALDEDCRMQARLSVETRTTAYHVRSGEFPEEQLSVYLTARRFGSLEPGTTYESVMLDLNRVCKDLLDRYVIGNVLQPLQRTIATK